MVAVSLFRSRTFTTLKLWNIFGKKKLGALLNGARFYIVFTAARNIEILLIVLCRLLGSGITIFLM